MKKFLVMALTVVSLNKSFAASYDYDYVSKNDQSCDLFDPDMAPSMNSILSFSPSKSKAKFDNALAYALQEYKGVFKKYGMNLTIVPEWDNMTVNAYAEAQGTNRFVTVFGGIYRTTVLTEDALLAVLCHEFGHHLAGKPTHPYGEIYSAEGQSDYYAANVCLPILFKRLDNKAYLKTKKVSFFIKTKCDSKYKSDSAESYICQRSLLAGLSLAEVLGSEKYSYENKEKLAVDDTNRSYPSVQCRLDTMLAGSLCNRKGSPVRDREGSPNNCNLVNFLESKNARPGCWFKTEE